jgi:hypothetical protein
MNFLLIKEYKVDRNKKPILFYNFNQFRTEYYSVLFIIRLKDIRLISSPIINVLNRTYSFYKTKEYKILNKPLYYNIFYWFFSYY